MIPAGEHFERALELTEDPLVRARLQSEVANSLVATGDPRGLEYVRQALSVLDPETNPMETAHVLGIEGRFHHLAGHHEKAAELLKRAAELVESEARAKTISTFAAATIPTVFSWLAGAYEHLALFYDADVWAKRALDFGTAQNILFAQALGNEFLGEHAFNRGDHEAALQYAMREREIAAKLHSRERRAWTYLVTSMSYWYGGDWVHAEEEFREGIALSESIGELRPGMLLKGNLATLLADKATGSQSKSLCGNLPGPVTSIEPAQHDALLDEALQMALDNFSGAEALGLVYSRAEGHRALGHVRFRRGELDEAEQICAAAMAFLADTESRVSRLWLGPVYIETVMALSKRYEAEGKLEESRGRHEEAATLADDYSALTASCQSPRFSREAERLSRLVSKSSP
jgi:tetratricopeptide (TPR) repeat protein